MIEAIVTFARALDDYDGREAFVVELAAVPNVGDWFYLDDKGYRNLKHSDYQITYWLVACVTHHLSFHSPDDDGPDRLPRTSVDVLVVPLPKGAEKGGTR